MDQVENYSFVLAEILELNPDHGLFRVAGDLVDFEVGKSETIALNHLVEIPVGFAIDIRTP